MSDRVQDGAASNPMGPDGRTNGAATASAGPLRSRWKWLRSKMFSGFPPREQPVVYGATVFLLLFGMQLAIMIVVTVFIPLALSIAWLIGEYRV